MTRPPPRDMSRLAPLVKQLTHHFQSRRHTTTTKTTTIHWHIHTHHNTKH